VNERYASPEAPAHIWFGVSVENEQTTSRIMHLQNARAAIRFLSIEPLIAPIGNVSLERIDWVIVGGESGPRARPMKPEWVISVRDQCQSWGVPFFFKQWGGFNKKKTGRKLDGRTWDETPLGRAPGAHAPRLAVGANAIAVAPFPLPLVS